MLVGPVERGNATVNFAVVSTILTFVKVYTLDPNFDTPITNVTVKAGDDAILPCSIDFLGKYKVVWMDEDSSILTFDQGTITDDTRFIVDRPYTKDWNLKLSRVVHSDEGEYKCQINTIPPREKIVKLRVIVPASIIDEQSTGDVVKREGETVVLVCNVTGIPAPDVTWYRKSIHTTSPSVREKIGLTGEMLIITNASRYCEDTYECVADNGVAMPDSRIMNVKIEFAPEIHLPTKTMGQYKGRDTVILCKITAHPHRINFWELNGREIQTRTGKYLVEVYDGTEPHEQVMSLSIKDLGPNDFGWYSCIAANQFGKAAKDMKLYELEVQTTRNEYQEPNDQNRPTAPEIVLPPGGGGGNSGKSSSTSKTTTTTAYPEVQAGNLINGGSNHGKYTSILMVVLAVMSNIFFQWIRT